MIISKVDSLLDENDFSFVGCSVLIAVSGGMDSMSMLHFFVNYKNYYGIEKIYVAHFNHNLRGLESDLDEICVQQYCEKLHITCITENGLLNTRTKPKTDTVESWARKLRYVFLKTVSDTYNTTYILTAHTMNDSAETVLFNLTRGTGLRGVCSIPFINGNVVRPFLHVQRTELEDYVKTNSIPYCVDSTNLSIEFSRNRIRNIVIPELSVINERVIENIARFSSFVSQAERYITEQAKYLLEEASHDVGYNKNKLNSLDEMMLSYVLKEMLTSEGIVNIEKKTIDELLEVVKGRKKAVQIDKSHLFHFEGDIVSVSKIHKEVTTEFHLPLEFGSFRLPNGIVIIEKCDILSLNTHTKQSVSNSIIDYDKIKGKAYFRNRITGDRFSSYSRKQTKSVKKLFNERGIPVSLRSSIPLLVDEEGVIYIAGEGVCSRVSLDDNTSTAISITYIEDNQHAEE